MNKKHAIVNIIVWRHAEPTGDASMNGTSLGRREPFSIITKLHLRKQRIVRAGGIQEKRLKIGGLPWLF